MRIYTLAKELKLDSKVLVDLLSQCGITVKGSALASLTEEELHVFRAFMAKSVPPKPNVQRTPISATVPDTKPATTSPVVPIPTAVNFPLNPPTPLSPASAGQDRSTITSVPVRSVKAETKMTLNHDEAWKDFDPTLLTQQAFMSLGIQIDMNTLNDILISLLQRRHLLLWGPPGTGKSEIAKAIPRILFPNSPIPFDMVTANASWTTYDVIGGLELSNHRTRFRPGFFTQTVNHAISVEGRRWLIIDEINRADIDRAMGAMFTSLQDFTLSVQERDKPELKSISIPARFRVVATMNAADKNTLFTMSSALLRRFATIYIPPVTDFASQKDLVTGALSRFLAESCSITETRIKELVNNPKFLVMRDNVISLIQAIREKSMGVDGSAPTPELSIGNATVIDLLKFVLIQAILEGEVAINDKTLDRAFCSQFLMQIESLHAAELELLKHALDTNAKGLTASRTHIDGWIKRQRVSFVS